MDRVSVFSASALWETFKYLRGGFLQGDANINPWKVSIPRKILKYMMTSSNGNILRVIDLLCGIHRSAVNSPHRGQWRGALMFSLICAWINGWVNNRDAGDLRRHRPHYDVIVMNSSARRKYEFVMGNQNRSTESCEDGAVEKESSSVGSLENMPVQPALMRLLPSKSPKIYGISPWKPSVSVNLQW